MGRTLDEDEAGPLAGRGEFVPDDAELRRRVIDRVIDLGGEVIAVEVDHGEVWLLGRIGEPGQAALVARLLRRIDGVHSVSSVLTYLEERSREPVGR